jgi:hypothetical protein
MYLVSAVMKEGVKSVNKRDAEKRRTCEGKGDEGGGLTVRREDVDMRRMRKSWERTGKNWGRDTMGKTEKEGKGERLFGSRKREGEADERCQNGAKWWRGRERKGQKR